MEQEIIALVNQRIIVHYTDIKGILLAAESYEKPVDTQHLSLYFRFLETALQQPHNRLVSLTAFICNQEDLLSDLMYPLAMLRVELRERIKEKCMLACTLANGLHVGGIDPGLQVLCNEKHLGRQTKK